jgi:hypothetical protein
LFWLLLMMSLLMGATAMAMRQRGNGDDRWIDQSIAMAMAMGKEDWGTGHWGNRSNGNRSNGATAFPLQ